ncbi:unnamed protein product [Pedinophyceae sp. YPF-701]|nr:unnamed protein product [Pedinophyceae sp. YPF-701]
MDGDDVHVDDWDVFFKTAFGPEDDLDGVLAPSPFAHHALKLHTSPAPPFGDAHAPYVAGDVERTASRGQLSTAVDDVPPLQHQATMAGACAWPTPRSAAHTVCLDMGCASAHAVEPGEHVAPVTERPAADARARHARHSHSGGDAPARHTRSSGVQVEHMQLVRGGSGRPRLRWSAELHAVFVRAVEELGGPWQATPKQIVDRMEVPGLTILHVKTHLQKYRHQGESSTPSPTGASRKAGTASDAEACEIEPVHTPKAAAKKRARLACDDSTETDSVTTSGPARSHSTGLPPLPALPLRATAPIGTTPAAPGAPPLPSVDEERALNLLQQSAAALRVEKASPPEKGSFLKKIGRGLAAVMGNRADIFLGHAIAGPRPHRAKPTRNGSGAEAQAPPVPEAQARQLEQVLARHADMLQRLEEERKRERELLRALEENQRLVERLMRDTGLLQTGSGSSGGGVAGAAGPGALQPVARTDSAPAR